MQTQSHFLITAVAAEALKARGVAVHQKALLLGSFMPDVPLTVLTLGWIAWVRALGPWLGAPVPREQVFGAAYDALYFSDPVWVVGHSALHAPLMIAALLGLGFWGRRRGWPWAQALVWFAIGCAGHSLIDILTHVGDGPLLLFPFDWGVRFRAPISYWDERYGGVGFTRIELALDGVIVSFFALRWLWRRWQRRPRAGEGAA